MEFHKLSYELQVNSYKQNDDTRQRLVESWFNDNTVDYWRHFRMIAPLKPIFSTHKGARCLTIGDGRFGLDSIKLKKLEPTLDVLPTDISTDLLEKAKEKELISDFSCENAEHLSFGDDAFDFSICIESYHHFPRPAIAFYEMLRVSKRAIILVEPNDIHPKAFLRSIIDSIKKGIKKIIKKPIFHEDTWRYEESGNYIYSVSKREFEKMALSLNLPTLAFLNFNDYYEEGVEFADTSSDSKTFKKVKRKISNANRRSKLGLQNYSSLIAVIFKQEPDEHLISEMRREGFEVIPLPRNPHAGS